MRVGEHHSLFYQTRVVRGMHYAPAKIPGTQCEHVTYGLCTGGKMLEIVTNVLFRVMAAIGKLMTAGGKPIGCP